MADMDDHGRSWCGEVKTQNWETEIAKLERGVYSGEVR